MLGREGLLDTMVDSTKLAIKKNPLYLMNVYVEGVDNNFILVLNGNNSKWPKHINTEVEHEKCPFQFPCMCEAMARLSTKVPNRY